MLAFRTSDGVLHVRGWRCETCEDDRTWRASGDTWTCVCCGRTRPGESVERPGELICDFCDDPGECYCSSADFRGAALASVGLRQAKPDSA